MNLLQRVWNFLVDQDKALNALVGGKPDQTISGSCGRALERKKLWAPPVVAVINFFAYLLVKERNHCQNAAAIEAQS